MPGKILIAEDHADTREAEVLVTDLFMSERDGFETLTAFRKNFPRTRIIVISGDGKLIRGSYLESAQWVGADAVLRKPVAPAELLRVIGEVLSNP